MGKKKKKGSNIQKVNKKPQSNNLAQKATLPKDIDSAKARNAEKRKAQEKETREKEAKAAEEAKKTAEQKAAEQAAIAKREEEDPPIKPKGGAAVFHFLDKVGDIFFLNMIFVITCIPIITIGAAFTALYYSCYKMAENKEGTSIVKLYFRSFKANFKQATILWFLMLFVLAGAYVSYVGWYYTDNNLLLMLTGFILLIVSLFFPLQFPLLARYDNTCFTIIKNSFMLFITKFKSWAVVFFAWGGPIIVYAMNPNFFVLTWFFWIVYLFAFVAYGTSFSLLRLFAQLESEQEA
ncbi:MAG: YesL family protein [Lachnospiraceae bacterium]|nr:YesL family protein [Lachnospiraceae bacterium]